MERRRKRGEKKKEEAEKEKRINARRMQIIEGQIEEHFNEVRLIQSALTRSTFIPFLPEESEACVKQALIDACNVTTTEMIESGRYPRREEQAYIRRRLNDMLPKWNKELSAKFNSVMTQMSSRSEEELVVRRNEHPDAREIEQFIPDDLLERWLYYKDKFIKAYYYWEVVPLQTECSRINALNNFLSAYDEKFRRKVFSLAELAQPMPLIIKVPAKKDFPMPFLPGTSVPDRSITDAEVDEAFKLEETWRRPSIHNVGTLEVKVFSAYTVPKEMIEKDLEAKEKEKVEEVTEKEKEEKDEAAGNP